MAVNAARREDPTLADIGFVQQADEPRDVLEQVVGQVHAADAVVGDPDTPVTVEAREELADQLGAEAVVAEEDVTDARDQDAGHYICRIRR